LTKNLRRMEKVVILMVEHETSFGKEADIVEIITKLERVMAEAQLLRDLFTQKDERLSQLTGELGELRGLVVKAESANQDNIMRLEKLDAMLTNLDPVEIEKTLAMRERLIVEAQANIERLDKMLEDLRGSYLEMASKIDKLGNFESISKVYRDVDAALSTVKRKENNVSLLSGKVETTFFEMEKRLIEFEKAKPVMERTEDMANEMIKNLSDLNIKMTNYPNREEVDDIRKGIRTEAKEDVKPFEEQLSKAMEEIGELKASIADLPTGVEQVPVNVPDISELQESLTQDLEAFKGEMEEKLSSIPSATEGTDVSDFESFKEEMESKLSNISKSVDTLNEKNLDLAEKIREDAGYETTSRLNEEVGEMKATLAELSARSEEQSVVGGVLGEQEESILRDIEVFKNEVESKLAALSDTVNSIKERGPDAAFQLDDGPTSEMVTRLREEIGRIKDTLADMSTPTSVKWSGDYSLQSKIQLKEFSALLDKMKNELQRVAARVDEGSHMDTGASDRISRIEEMLKRTNDSLGKLNEKLASIGETPGADIQGLKDSQRQFEDDISQKLMQTREALDEAIKETLEDISSKVEGASAGVPDMTEVKESVRRDFNTFKDEVESRLSQISGSIESSKEQGLESKVKFNEYSALLAEIGGELKSLEGRVDVDSRKSVEAEDKITGFEDVIGGVNESVKALSEKLSEFSTPSEVGIDDLKNMQSELEEYVNSKLVDIKEASGEAISEALNEISSEIRQLPATIKEARELQDSIKGNFGELQEELENKLTQVSTSVHVSREQSQGAVDRLSEVSASLKYLENMFKELKEKLSEAAKEHEK